MKGVSVLDAPFFCTVIFSEIWNTNELVFADRYLQLRSVLKVEIVNDRLDIKFIRIFFSTTPPQ